MDLAFLTFHDGGRATTQSLIAAIARAVDAGLLLPGDKMPSSREIGRALGISRTVVVRAFDILIARGYLTAVKGSGTIVASSERKTPLDGGNTIIECETECDAEDLDFSPGHDRSFNWADHYSEIARRLIDPNNRVPFLHDVDHDPASMVVPAEFLPLREWSRIYSSLCRNGSDTRRRETNNDVFGYRPLRSAICEFLRRTKGIVCTADQIVLYSGPQASLAHVTELLSGPGQLAVCEDPGYPGSRKQFRARGAEVMKVPVDDDGLVTDALKSLPLTAHWLYSTPSCQDPIGSVLSEKRRKDLLDWCWSTGTAIIEDAWDSDFRYGSAAPLPLFAMDRNNSVIYVYSFWRLLCPLTALSIVVVPEALIELFKTSKFILDRQYPSMDHYVLTEMLESGYLIKHIRNVWKTYRSRRQSLIFWLKRCLTDRVEILSHGGGMHFVARFKASWSQEEIANAATQANLPLLPTTRYYFDRAPKNEFLVQFADVEAEKAQAVAEQFVSVLLAHDKQGAADAELVHAGRFDHQPYV